MDILKLQQGLLSWFRLTQNSLKTYGSIENVCINLYCPYFSNEIPSEKLAKEAKEYLFQPLVRYGIVEFYGHGKYGLSPASSLHLGNRILLCNISLELKDVKVCECIYNSYLGIEVYQYSNELRSALGIANISSIKYSFAGLLKLMPSFDKIVNSWEDDTVIDPTGYVFLTSNKGWGNSLEKPVQGVFKKSDKVYAQRVVKIADNKWKQIPSRVNNPDSFNVAMMWSQTRNDISISYNRETSVLQVKTKFFPLLIERLLLINTLLENSAEFNSDKREYFLRQQDFELLNKLFGNKIQVI